MRNYAEDIICARATPIGPSAIAIVRVSGKDSHSILKKIFKTNNSSIKNNAEKIKNNTENYKSHKAYYGNIYDDEIIDNVLVLTYQEGGSFTDEESFEINCHGSDLIVSLIIKLLLKNGCRLAEGGEFSKRAFLNGKIDLTEAEAIMDIVNSSSIEGAKIANRQLQGRLRNEIDSIKEKLSNLLASIEVLIDYPEEDLEYDYEIWKNKLKTILNDINILQRDFNRGRAYRDGINSVIIGKTNVGKSTFFNLLLNEDKAIVSHIAGTTRDYIDSLINISGIPVRIFDTAGLRETKNIIEKEGTKRTKKLFKKADTIIYLIDGSNPILDDDIKNINNIINDINDKKIIFVINKIDLTSNQKLEEIEIFINTLSDNMKKQNNIYNIVRVSALKKDGLDDFNNKFLELNFGEKITEKEDPIITNERHYNLLDTAKKSVAEIENIDINELDILSYHIRDALNYIGEITGEVRSVDILDKIFSSFCVGK